MYYINTSDRVDELGALLVSPPAEKGEFGWFCLQEKLESILALVQHRIR